MTWRLRRLQLFFGIVWRRWDEDERLSWRVAWEVATIVWRPEEH